MWTQDDQSSMRQISNVWTKIIYKLVKDKNRKRIRYPVLIQEESRTREKNLCTTTHYMK